MCEDFSFDKSILPSQLLNDDEVILEEWGFFFIWSIKIYIFFANSNSSCVTTPPFCLSLIGAMQ